MKTYLTYILLIGICLSCGKKPPAPEVEENIVFELNAAQAAISTSSSYTFTVAMKSKLPKAAEEAGGAAVTPQNAPINALTASTDVTVQNLPRQKWVVVTVKVISISTATNTSTQTFRVVYK
jgi:hypothetical protein